MKPNLHWNRETDSSKARMKNRKISKPKDQLPSKFSTINEKGWLNCDHYSGYLHFSTLVVLHNPVSRTAEPIGWVKEYAGQVDNFII